MNRHAKAVTEAVEALNAALLAARNDGAVVAWSVSKDGEAVVTLDLAKVSARNGAGARMAKKRAKG